MTAIVVLDAKQPYGGEMLEIDTDDFDFPQRQPLAPADGFPRCREREMLRLALMSSENRAASYARAALPRRRRRGPRSQR